MPEVVASVIDAMQAKDATAYVVERWRNGVKHRIDAGRAGPLRFALDCSIGSLHYLRDGIWRPVNTDLVAAGNGYAFANDTMAGRVLVGADGSRRVYPRAEDAGAYVDFGPTEYWDGAKWQTLAVAAPTKSVDRATWAADGVTVRLVMDADREKVELVLRDALSPTRFRWPCKLTGLTWDGWVLRNGRGEAVAEHLTPWAEDVVGETREVVSRLADGYFEMEADCTGLAWPVIVDPPLDYLVGTTADDGMWVGTGFSATAMNVGAYNGARHCFCRFTGVAVPYAAIIDVSYLNCVAHGMLVGSIANVHLKVSANNVGDAIAPTTAAEAEALALTSGVDWDPSVWTAHARYNSPSLSADIGTVVSRVDWASGQDMQFVIKDDGSTNNNAAYIRDYSDNASEAAGLHIEYTAGGGHRLPEVV